MTTEENMRALVDGKTLEDPATENIAYIKNGEAWIKAPNYEPTKLRNMIRIANITNTPP